MRVSQRPGGPETKWYDCVLMDLEMPGTCLFSADWKHASDSAFLAVMDGFEAVRQIRRDEASGVMERSLVIALTGNARQGQIDQALESGMDEGTCLTAGGRRSDADEAFCTVVRYFILLFSSWRGSALTNLGKQVIKPYKLAQLLSTMETMVERLEVAKRAGIEQETA